ncbi:MAG: glycosyltransferase family 39 protein [Flavobacteriales bacterium]
MFSSTHEIKKYSWAAFILCAVFLICTRISVTHEKEISWDILGYYMYLPATFVHDDPFLEDISWLKETVAEKELATTLYFISGNKEGDTMYFFLMGMSVLYLPWFLLAHALAHILDYPPDGFSAPYVCCLVIGATIYTLVGLWFLRKILLKLFSDKLTAVVLVTIYIGTNTVHHLTEKNLETVNMLFMLAAIVVWYTIKWHESEKSKHLYIIAASIALMTLVKPSEILIGILPLLYGVTGKSKLIWKLDLLKRNIKPLIIAILIGLIILSPQLVYWKTLTGNYIYDSYSNEGVGLDWWSPYFTSILFSFKKGWLIYTPVMILAVLGFVAFYRKNQALFIGAFIYFMCSFYLMSSWTEWWYGSSFSCRPVITLYVILAISLGYALQWASQKSNLTKVSAFAFVLVCILLNQFQWWQFRNWILHDSRMTKEYVFENYFSTSVSEEDRKLLEYNFGNFTMDKTINPPISSSKKILYLDFTEEQSFVIKKNIIKLDSTEAFYRLNSSDAFALVRKQSLNEFTEAKFFYYDCEITLRFNEEIPSSERPLYFINCIERVSGIYGYNAQRLAAPAVGEWHTFRFRYSAPRIRSYNDNWMMQIWNQGKHNVDIKKLVITCNDVNSN